MISVERYLDRIGHRGALIATEDTLASLHAAHSEAIPFENLDIHLGKALSSDIAALFAKMVLHRRGGYCFEQNGLFAAMLERIGFKVRPVLGRTTFGAKAPRPRGHLLSLVETGGRTWIADVGFGGHGLLEPVPFEMGRSHRAGGETYRVIASGNRGLELEMQTPDGWVSLYWFDEMPCYPVDVDVMNFYHSHSMDSFFYNNRVVASARRDRRLMLTNNEMKIVRGGDVEIRLIEDEATYLRVLLDDFDIELPPDAHAELRPHPSIGPASQVA
ncbi:arylamine N-acetyltransferase family protein [Microvirga lotononidis]|uniref:Arylamine N-acetyltransferase n=1 Tax=Microvirga lotononidis TaxID=864069 RepID=I4YM60_9HYPH|nr:arylamine N-acetyltransferase [Microvirga lotononidis]EIM25052.1 arylamine N-acetyltransferase [Microvirga lotononidis]WQO29458.1 arylamine N-acetyltransferase [Microvirga lotononidis]